MTAKMKPSFDASEKRLTTPGFEANPAHYPLFTSQPTHHIECSVEPISWFKYHADRGVPKLVIQRMPHCCGVYEIYGIDYGWPPREICAGILENYLFHPKVGTRNGVYTTIYEPKYGMVNMHPYFVFETTGAGGDRQDNGTPLKAFIEKHGLGTCTGFGPKRNPTGSPTLQLFVWVPDQEALLAWYKIEREKMDQPKKNKKAEEMKNKTIHSLAELGDALETEQRAV